MFLTAWRVCRALFLASLALTLTLLPPMAQAAADYSVGADLNGGTATLWFKSNVGSTWVDAHYRVNAGAQQNVRMTYNSAAARYETSFPASSGQQVQASFTYTKNGAAYDSAVETLTLGGGGGGGMAAAPQFSPAAGTYTAAQSVTLASATPGAVIRYTTDGSTPTAGSPVYAGPLSVAASTTVKAYASATSLTDSAVVSAAYVIDANAGPFTHGGVTANGTVTLWFKGPANTAWADIHYNAGAGQQNLRMTYNSQLARHEASFAAATGTVVGYSFTYYTTSGNETPTYSYTVGGGGGDTKVARPTFSPAPGSFTGAQDVALVV